ncbi:hypothetical protein NTCA1_53620 [Novosphingobium sp. TCA1]|nr:hypothetical protein NTCA1_53620 [Novosphingobium sp. TCA1]
MVDDTRSCAISEEVLTWLRTNATGEYRRSEWITFRRWLGGTTAPFPDDLPPPEHPTVPAIGFENADDAALFRLVWGE